MGTKQVGAKQMEARRPAVSGSALAARWIHPLAIATLVGNIAIVVTGGAVRLTASGLGCPTWPQCTQGSFVPHGALGVHGVIEFGNRMMTFVLAAIAVATWVAAMNLLPRSRSVRRLATALALGIPGQAVLGGVTVLTDLNPWIVGLHLMLSMLMISAAVLLIFRLRDPEAGVPSRLTVRLAVAAYGSAFVVLYLGTVVTGSGPHAGDVDAPRNGLDPQLWSHVHAAAVYVLVAVSVATVAVLHRAGAATHVRRAGWVLVGVELAQAAVGFTQYYLDLPELLVGLHLLGAALLAAAVTRLLLVVAGTKVRRRHDQLGRTLLSRGGRRG
ncbi:MAG TPA: COX15/CtaA family protein [Nocardioidaceae bacterium]|nr:COX15/CtaA family protein [Nocardioidaceae bacterium]